MNRLRAALASQEREENRLAVYVSPRELMQRWKCSRSQVDRIAKRENFTRLLLGHGKNGMVRYTWSDVLKLEEAAKA